MTIVVFWIKLLCKKINFNFFLRIVLLWRVYCSAIIALRCNNFIFIDSIFIEQNHAINIKDSKAKTIKVDLQKITGYAIGNDVFPQSLWSSGWIFLQVSWFTVLFPLFLFYLHSRRFDSYETERTITVFIQL